MENWKCSKCSSLNHYRRNTCWRCGLKRNASEQQVPISNTSKSYSNVRKKVSIASAIGGCGLFLTALALIPSFWTMFSSKTLPEAIVTIQPLKVEFMSEYQPSGLFLYPEGTEDNVTRRVSFPAFNSLYLSVTNQTDETLIFDNRIPIEVLNYQPTSENVKVYIFIAGGGGGFRDFVADIPASTQEEVWAIFNTSDADPTQKLPEFYTLQPGEVEVFNIQVRFRNPGKYEFRPGIQYFANGEKYKIWTENTVQTLIPKNMLVWYKENFDINHYSNLGDCIYNFDGDFNGLGGNYYENFYSCNFPQQ